MVKAEGKFLYKAISFSFLPTAQIEDIELLYCGGVIGEPVEHYAKTGFTLSSMKHQKLLKVDDNFCLTQGTIIKKEVQ